MKHPTQRYYEGAQGRWRGAVCAEVTDLRALIGAMGLLRGLSVAMMAWWPPWLGRLQLMTTVSCLADERVEHTTAITWWGLPMMRSVEHLSLLEDGVHFSLSGASRLSLMPWRRLPMSGAGQVDASARHATYTLSWMGTEFTQTTTRGDEVVTLHQEAPGFKATQSLRAIGR